jgi:hypothetical protein
MTASRSRARGSLLTVQRAGKRRDTAAVGSLPHPIRREGLMSSTIRMGRAFDDPIAAAPGRAEACHPHGDLHHQA